MVTGRGPGGVTGKLGVSWRRRRPEEVALASSWEALGVRGADASSLAGELKPPVLSSLPPARSPFSPSCPLSFFS